MSEASFYAMLEGIDADVAEAARAAGCGCGGVLHRATYPRKPRGGPRDLPPGYDRRLSFCCARRDCRQRRTPPSVRFLGRRVYLGAVVVLVSAMRHGLTPRRVATLVLAWHLLVKAQDYAWARPSLTEKKLRTLELRAGSPPQRGQRGRAHGYNLKVTRQREQALSAQAERAYQRLVAHWQPRRPKETGAGAAKRERR